MNLKLDDLGLHECYCTKTIIINRETVSSGGNRFLTLRSNFTCEYFLFFLVFDPISYTFQCFRQLIRVFSASLSKIGPTSTTSADLLGDILDQISRFDPIFDQVFCHSCDNSGGTINHCAQHNNAFFRNLLAKTVCYHAQGIQV